MYHNIKLATLHNDTVIMHIVLFACYIVMSYTLEVNIASYKYIASYNCLLCNNSNIMKPIVSYICMYKSIVH